jgi:tetratricopeptide (TPR) repeat protein
VYAALAAHALAADSNKAIAKAHFEAATRLYDIHEYAKALEEYKAAYLAKPDPAFLFNVGQCYRRLGKFDQALEFYQEYLKKAPPDDPNRPNVEARIRNTDTSDLFESDTAPRPAAPPAQPPPLPPQAPPVQRPPTPPEARPVAAPRIEGSAGTPTAAAGSSVPVEPQKPPPPAFAEPTYAKPAGLDLNAVQPAERVNTGTPFYKTWWFWTGVGAVVVAGTVAAIVISKSGSNGNTATTALGTQGVFQ